jgi:hypothetical protein
MAEDTNNHHATRVRVVYRWPHRHILKLIVNPPHFNGPFYKHRFFQRLMGVVDHFLIDYYIDDRKV